MKSPTLGVPGVLVLAWALGACTESVVPEKSAQPHGQLLPVALSVQAIASQR